MTTRNIDDQLRQYYAGTAPARESLERLKSVLARSDSGRSEAERKTSSPRVWQSIAIAASISVIFLAAAVLLLRKGGSDTLLVADSGLSERIAEEAARRHGRCIEEIDFRAEELAQLLAQMDKVDFVGAVPSRRGIGSMKLKGAHYCVLDGQIAIHAVLVDDSGAIVSLFETKAGANMASFRAGAHRLGSNDVELWQEAGVLYAVVFAAPVA